MLCFYKLNQHFTNVNLCHTPPGTDIEHQNIERLSRESEGRGGILEMNRLRTLTFFLGLFTVVALFAGCGEGEVASQESFGGSSTLLCWEPPATTVDQDVIDPYEDLDYYEIYVSENHNGFTDDLVPAGQTDAVVAVPSANGTPAHTLVLEFDLDQLPVENLPNAKNLWVSLRAVGTDKQKSAFMVPILWQRS